MGPRAAPEREAAAMQQALAALSGLDRDTENAVMVWLSHRLREQRRGAEASAYNGMPAPTEWRPYDADGNAGSFDTLDEAFEDSDVGPWGIVEITGHAAVRQEFFVGVPIDDGGGGFDLEQKAFPTREEAEKYVADMQASGDPA